MKKQKKSRANDAVAAEGIGDTSSVPSTSTKTKQKKRNIAKGPISTQQSGNADVKAMSSKATANKQQKEGKDDPTIPLNTAKNILQKSPIKESASTQKQRKKTAGKTPLKEAASTECPGIERVGDNDVGGVTVGIEHMSGEN